MKLKFKLLLLLLTLAAALALASCNIINDAMGGMSGGDTTAAPETTKPPVVCTEHKFSKTRIVRYPTCIDPGVRVYVCSVCGAESERESFPGVAPDDCYIENGVCQICGRACDHSGESTTVYSLKEGATSCEEGVVVTETCKSCGFESSRTEKAHVMIPDEKTFGIYPFCESHELSASACLCGKEKEIIFTKGDLAPSENDDGSRVASCQSCGLKVVQTRRNEQDHKTCTFTTSIRTEVFYYNGSIDFVEFSDSHENHTYNVTATLLPGATSCLGGVKETYLCIDCGSGFERETKSPGEHVMSLTYVDLTKYDSCGKHEIISRACACGAESSVTTGGFAIQSEHRYRCRDCKLTVELSTEWGERGKDCLFKGTRRYDVTSDGHTVVATLTEPVTTTQHETKLEGVLAPGSKSCTDGVNVISSCLHCSYSETQKVNFHYNQEKFFDLSAYSGVICERHKREIYKLSCPCGEQDEIRHGLWVQLAFESYDDNVFGCNDCAIRVAFTRTYGTPNAKCETTATNRYRFYVGETLILDESITDEGEIRHDYALSAALNPGAKSCEDGVTVTKTCKRCGDRQTERLYHHYYIDTPIDMSGHNVCASHASHVWMHDCVCGEFREISYYSEPFNQIYSNETGQLLECTKCELWILYRIEQIRQNNKCEVEDRLTVSVLCGDKTVCERVRSTVYVNHVGTVNTYTLNAGSKSCTDGVTVTRVCSGCGENYGSYTAREHGINFTDVDLGNVKCCERHEIRVGTCACGAQSRCEVTWFKFPVEHNGVHTNGCEDCDVSYTEESLPDLVTNADGTKSRVYIYTFYNKGVKLREIEVRQQYNAGGKIEK